MRVRQDELPSKENGRNGHNKESAKRKYRLKPSLLQYIRPYLQHTLLNLSLPSNITFLWHSLGGILEHKLSHLPPIHCFILSWRTTDAMGQLSGIKRARHGPSLCSCPIIHKTDQAQWNAQWPCGVGMRIHVCTLLASKCTPTRDETKSSLLSHLENLRKFGYITKFTDTMKTSHTHTPRVCSTTAKRCLRRDALREP